MFGITKDRLAENLERLNRALCLYTPLQSTTQTSRCDCKYNARGIKALLREDPHAEAAQREARRYSEESGCPELRLVRLLLDALSDEEYTELAERAGVDLDF